MAVSIQITDALVIKSDGMQWMLCKNKGLDENGKPRLHSFMYQGTLEKIVQSTGQYMLRHADASNIDELIAAAEKISKLLSQKFTASVNLEIKNES
jgi:hypothetical protein